VHYFTVKVWKKLKKFSLFKQEMSLMTIIANVGFPNKVFANSFICHLYNLSILLQKLIAGPVFTRPISTASFFKKIIYSIIKNRVTSRFFLHQFLPSSYSYLVTFTVVLNQCW